jgi:hypothetical protein
MIVVPIVSYKQSAARITSIFGNVMAAGKNIPHAIGTKDTRSIKVNW